MKRTAIIMAGGAGERFWPLSRRRKPKQLLQLETTQSMLEQSIERILPVIGYEDIYIITSELLLEPIRQSLANLPAENVIAEPNKRNTAPCLALGAAIIAAKYSNDYNPSEISIAVLTADQSIKPNDGFVFTVDNALSYVEQNDAIATIGIQPSRPDTGYGYIEISKPFIDNMESQIQKIVGFHEKPDHDRAAIYLQKGNYLWNSGMFFWRLDVFREQMIKHLPEVGENIDEMISKSIGKTNIRYSGIFEPVKEIFCQFPDISIDYGLMEKVSNAYVAKAQFLWDDIGSWDSLDRIRERDEHGNIDEGPTALHEVTNSIVINHSSDDKIITSVIGLDNIVVVVTDDAVLVCDKNKVQDVKKGLQLIKEKKGEKWL